MPINPAKMQEALAGDEALAQAGKWLNLADANYYAASTLNTVPDNMANAEVSAAAVSIVSLAVELGIKGLLTLEGTPFEFIHDNQVLYGKLSLETRNEIGDKMKPVLAHYRKAVSRLGIKGPCNMFQALASYKSSYVNLRYGHLVPEGGFWWPAMYEFFADRAAALHPAWFDQRIIHKAAMPKWGDPTKPKHVVSIFPPK